MDRSLPFRLPRRPARGISRRGVVAAAVGALALRPSFIGARQATPIAGGGPTGTALPGLAAFDGAMLAVMEAWGLPGLQLAVAHDGRLVLDRGYGVADPTTGDPVVPTSRFRIASVSKVITAVAVLALIDDGAFGLDDPVFPRLSALEPPRNAPRDPRLDEITVRHLLTHAGGWDSTTGFDPQYHPLVWMEAGLLGVQAPPSAAQIVRAMMAMPLDFDPGTRSVYSNFGFNVLGRLIEAATGENYDEFVLRRVLEPAGIQTMRLGRTRLGDRVRDEVVYLSPPVWPPQPSVFPGEGFVPGAYGSFYLEAMDSHGGWIAPAHDLVRFALAVDGRRGPAILRPETVRLMETTPRPAGTGEPGSSGVAGLGLGWNAVETPDGYQWSHAGALTGSTASWLARLADGTAIAVSANTLPVAYPAFFDALLPPLLETAGAIGEWPAGDLWAGVATPVPA
jgi:N-acyl-D-amino-acid deacylase